MSKQLLILISTLIFGCNHKPDALEGSVWYPVKIETNDYSTSLGLYAFEFGSDSTLTTYTLGTQHKVSSTYGRTGNKITLKTKQDSVTVTYNISDSNLIINFDTATTVYYTDLLNGTENDLAETLDRILVSKSWQLNSDLIEFNQSLDKGYIKPELHEELNDASIHFKIDNYYNYHEDIAWGSNHFNGMNFLVFGNSTGNFENQYFIIESVSDTLISGYKFDRDGQQRNIQLSAADNRNLKPAIIGNWNISSFEEIPSEFNELWDTFGTEEGISVSDLDNMTLSFNFGSDSSFQFSSGNKVISKGKWYSDKSGKVINLIAEYEDSDGPHYRTMFLSVIALDSTKLIVHKKEDIIQEDGSRFERKEYIETYKKVVTGTKTPKASEQLAKGI
ncbi:hypothetical protein [Reichenbachiella agariperforans]|uniref:hypothetical protein n=1 Tax=Reichenbachiella agariperforans TaxID=156994 RepID=UPI001C08A8ED|nr:hypothetical protein [Reichenbachiella agariperforans]MBU2914631.1 hypothetical protein [Reichenbachiella agariperforans]